MQKQTHLHYKSIGQGLPVLFLHGFSEDLSTWDKIVNLFEQHNLVQTFSLHCIDLIGHGQSIKPADTTPYSIDNVIQAIHYTSQEILSNKVRQGKKFQKYFLLGYSLGGRIAAYYALRHHLELQALILESSSFGIVQPNERRKRAEKDASLAKDIVENGIAFFENYWSKLEIFNTQSNLDQATQNAIKMRRLQNSPHALANTLRMTGQGNLPYIKDNFLQINLPTLYICGQYDVKYCDIADDLKQNSEHINVKIIDQAGHNVHTEKPEEFFNVLTKFLLQFKKQNHN